MPDLNFEITGVSAAQGSITPLLQFKLRINAAPETSCIHAALINAQVQIQAPQRPYTAAEKHKLTEVFGSAEFWYQGLRSRLWAHTNVTVGAFTGSVETKLDVPCTCDLNLFGTKYFSALDGGEVPLLFLFSGSVFYGAADGRLQVMPISWNKECAFRMQAAVWKELMQRHYPNTAWLPLRRDVFETLAAYKRERELLSWEDTVNELLQAKTPGNANGEPRVAAEVIA